MKMRARSRPIPDYRWRHRPIAGFDVETTGPTKSDQILAWAIVELHPSGEIGRIVQGLAQPQVPIRAEAARVHGWTRRKLEDAGASEYIEGMRDMVLALNSFIGDGWPICAYNGGRFDWPMAHHAAYDAQVSLQRPGLFIDPLILARRLHHSAGTHTLEHMAQHYGLPPQGDIHDPAHDAKLAGWLAYRMAKEMDGVEDEEIDDSLIWPNGPYQIY